MKVSIKFRRWSPQYLKSCRVPRLMTTALSPSRAQLRSPQGPQKACRGVTTPGPHMVSPWGLGWHGAEGSFGGASWPACGSEAPVHTSVPREDSGAAGPRVWSVPERACSCPVTFFQDPCIWSLPAAPLGPLPVSFTCSHLTAGDLSLHPAFYTNTFLLGDSERKRTLELEGWSHWRIAETIRAVTGVLCPSVCGQ